jgi:hypothetical protein
MVLDILEDVDTISTDRVAPEGYKIKGSTGKGIVSALISPHVATCYKQRPFWASKPQTKR